MLNRFHEKLGTAGLVVAIVALVAAMAGGAYAASGGLTGKQKKEVKTIAKSFQGKGPKGDAGQQGPAGANGRDGTNGKDGANGSPGAPGAKGKSVTVKVAGEFECLASGAGATVEEEGSGTPIEVCDGVEGPAGDIGPEGPKGEPWTPNGTLPESATEYGTWFAQSSAAGTAYAPISFPIKLGTAPSAMSVIFVPFLGSDDTCTAINFNAPPPPPAHTLCVYESASTNAEFDYVTDPSTAGEEEIAKTGGAVRYTMSGAGFASGTFAVTN